MRLLRVLLACLLSLACSRAREPAPPGTLVADAGGTSFVADDDYAYVNGSVGWVYHEQPAIFRVALDGGATQTFALGTAPWWGETLDDEALYFSTRDVDSGVASIVRLPKDGGAAQTLYTSNDALLEVAVDDTHVYWTSAAADSGTVMREPKDGGPPETLASDLSHGLAVDDAYVYWVGPPPDGGCWFCASVRRLPKSDGGTETLTTSAGLGTAITADDAGGVWWMNVQTDDAGAPMGAVVRFDEPTQQTRVVLLANVEEELELDSSHIFWAGFDGIYFASIDGGAGAQLAASQPNSGPRALAVRGGFVYWLDESGNLMRIAAPP